MSTPILPYSGTPSNTDAATTPEPIYSWETKSRDELIAWLLASAHRLDTRAERQPWDRDKLLKMATADRETAAWYQAQGGAR